YQAKAGGGAAKITPDEIKVTPILAPSGEVALQFTGPWSVEAGQAQGSNLSYRIVSLRPTLQVQALRLVGYGFGAHLFSDVAVDEAVATTAMTQDLHVYLKCGDVCHSQTSDDLNLQPFSTGLAVADRAILQAQQGTASMTGFVDWFVTCIPCV